MFGILFYLSLLFFTCAFLFLFRKKIVTVSNGLISNTYAEFFLFIFSISPIILSYGLRYGIGTDYFAYEKIYYVLKNADFNKYLLLHKESFGEYYVEFGYYVLNKLSYNYTLLLFLTGLLIYTFLFHGTKKLLESNNLALPFFIYFCTQFIYSMNGVRFSIAITIIFYGYNYIYKKKIIKWCIVVFIATLFHKTAIICLPFYFLGDFKSKKRNKTRDILYYAFIFLFPLFITLLFKIIVYIPLFSRYFQTERYALGSFLFKPKFLAHIIPVILPLLFVKPSSIFKDKKALFFFRIFLFQIPLRELGSLNKWLTRLVRFPQMVEIVFIPYILSKIKNKKLRLFLMYYYFLLYVFFFIYYAFVNDSGDSLSYQSIIFYPN